MRSASLAARLRAPRVAGADRDQPARDREIAAHAAAMAEEHRDQIGRAQDGPHRSTSTMTASERDDGDGDHRHHDRRLDAIALPDDGDVAGPVGHPDDAEGHRGDQRKEREDTRIIGGLKVPPSAPRRRRRRAAGWRRAPCCALRPWRSTAASGARASGGSLASSASAPANVALRRALLDARQNRRAVVAAHLFAHRADADELLARWPAAARGSPPSDGVRSDARSIGRTMAASSCPSAALPGTPEAANGSSSATALASGASGLTMASSAVNGSPCSTALRSADAATASREARSLPAAAERAVVCTSVNVAASLSMRLLVSRSAASEASARRDIAAALSASDFVAFSAAFNRPSTTGSVTGARGAACALSSRARRAAMIVDRLRIDAGGRGTCREIVQLLFDRGELRAQIGRGLATARRMRRRATTAGPRASRRPRRRAAWVHGNCSGRKANGRRRSAGGSSSGPGGSRGGSWDGAPGGGSGAVVAEAARQPPA